VRRPNEPPVLWPSAAEFVVRPEELKLQYRFPPGARRLGFERRSGDLESWRATCIARMRELLRIEPASRRRVDALRRTAVDAIGVEALVMEISPELSLPAYLLTPAGASTEHVVMALHGHGDVAPVIGAADDYHHAFALEIARSGRVVLCPELRGFGALRDLSAQLPGRRLDYWVEGRPRGWSLVTDGLQRGRSLIGATCGDILDWERWLAEERGARRIDVAGISYGGDLALIYPVFSRLVARIFASGTLGSFDPIFTECHNAPGHCVPEILEWLDRADIAGLNAPRELLLHYGELDTPGPSNFSASFNSSVPRALEEVRTIYAAFGAPDRVGIHVTPGIGHEVDNALLLGFLRS
jgi:dienelactone hydrolase